MNDGAAAVVVLSEEKARSLGVKPRARIVASAVSGVDPEIIRRVGTVHQETALAMARAARERVGADIGIATTGVAGPEPSEGKPVGTLHVALDFDGQTLTDERQISTTRTEFKRRAAMGASR